MDRPLGRVMERLGMILDRETVDTEHGTVVRVLVISREEWARWNSLSEALPR